MKQVMYTNGPDEIRVGPKNAQILMKRGVAVEFDDETAAALLKKTIFKEAKDKPNREGAKAAKG